MTTRSGTEYHEDSSEIREGRGNQKGSKSKQKDKEEPKPPTDGKVIPVHHWKALGNNTLRTQLPEGIRVRIAIKDKKEIEELMNSTHIEPDLGFILFGHLDVKEIWKGMAGDPIQWYMYLAKEENPA